MTRLLDRIQQASRPPLDLQFLHFICNHELTFIQALADQTTIPQDVIAALSTLSGLVSAQLNNRTVEPMGTEITTDGMGHYKYRLDREILQTLVSMGHSIPTIATLMGVSVSTVKRALKEYAISIRQTYSTILDNDLDELVRTIKVTMPNIGSRILKGRLQALGHRLPWTRIWETLRRVDRVGVLCRATGVGCVVRRSYSVQAPLSLVHVDTNHKLIRSVTNHYFKAFVLNL